MRTPPVSGAFIFNELTCGQKAVAASRINIDVRNGGPVATALQSSRFGFRLTGPVARHILNRDHAFGAAPGCVSTELPFLIFGSHARKGIHAFKANARQQFFAGQY